MDLTTTIIGVLIIVLCAVPLVLAHNKKKNREEQLKKSLFDYAEMHSGKITKHDLWPGHAIGLDENANMLFYTRILEGASSPQQVALDTIKGCIIVGDERPESTDKLELVLLSARPGTRDTVLEFYNQADSMQIHDELQLIKKWQGIIALKLK